MDSGNKIIFSKSSKPESQREQGGKRIKKEVVNHTYKLYRRFQIGFCATFSTTDPPAHGKTKN